jgi:predicted nucleotidyltransferase
MLDERAARGASGRFVVRIPPGLHESLRRAAAEAHLSLNEYCVRKLAASGSLEEPIFEVVERAAEQFGARLVGLVAFGSWARGDLTDESDVDLLVVVEQSVAIVRPLYRPWDEHRLSWDGRPVEVHIVHLPEPGETPRGFWAEAALEGIVLFERGLTLSRRLVEIRRRVAAGEISRRHAHGRAYWVQTA